MIGAGPIDVWNLATFDAELADKLEASATLIRAYYIEDRRLWLEREAQTLRGPMPSNPFATAYYALLDELTPAMNARMIRGWHHTLMTDDDVADLLEHGPQPTTIDGMLQRLERRVAAGDITRDDAAALAAASPFSGPRAEYRVGKFWMTSHPQEIDDGGVRPLLGKWGGESVSFKQLDGFMSALLQAIGRARVIEVAVRLSATPDAFLAAKAVVATLGRTLGAPAGYAGFDLYATEPLPVSAVLRVHSEGEVDYERLGRGYPEGFDDRFGDGE